MKFTPRQTAIITAAALLALAIVAAAIQFTVLADARDSVHPSHLTTATVAFVGIVVLDVVIAVGLWRLFRSEQPRLAALAGVLRLAYAAWLAVAVVFLIAAAAGTDRHAAARFRTFDDQWAVSLGVFGLHLLALGPLLWRYSRVIGALLVLAGVGYTIDGVTAALSHPTDLAAVTFVGEVVLIGWLLLRGGRRPADSHQLVVSSE